ncbi:MAG: putative carbohydrate binding:Glycosyltransferase 36:Glycosyltransferase 36 associated [Proteobacteria bacterium]|nr:putative carbohydrate binding:Glycosyltransferase 36:Glycosyltransferase 36 associated [Pseudomonadota bacterium]
MRAALYSTDQMAQHGKALAAAHRLAAGPVADRLLGRLAANENTLVDVCRQLTSVAAEQRRITPAGEWLLDNFYLIEEQIRTAKRHLPKGYSRELPRLANGPSAGHPRVYDIALETVAHGDGRVDPETLSRFVAAYQTVTDLRLGELWAIPIMLRLAVIENLRRVGVRIAAGWDERNLAELWADRMIEAAEHDPKNLILTIADMARSQPPMVSAFVAELARRLQGRGPALALPLTWMEQHLAESGLTIAQMVQAENQLQAADQVSISNSIGSLRIIGAMDWQTFVETQSIVEQTLLGDPGGIYGEMDFATRDRYRHATESIARKTDLSEGALAARVVELARAGAEEGGAAGHVGFYLVGPGLPRLESAVEVRHTFPESVRRAASRMPLTLYLGGVKLIAGLLAGSLVIRALPAGLPLWAMILLGLVALLATSQLAVSLVNWLASLLVSPQPLPKMDFSEGIPSASRTLVVVPTMLTSAGGVESLIEALEVRFLANRDPSLHFALLSDFLDAGQETLPEDAALTQLAGERIAALNAKYRTQDESDAADIFFLFHRPRRWNPEEQVWMGYERKRGKLADLNALLLNGTRDSFSLIAGDTAALLGTRYVITLDTDTQLPRDAALQFVGTMAHPLNRPCFDETLQRVISGYGILQPRVAVSLPGTNRSRLARLYGGEPGIDPYTRAVSDVYQDVFGEGSFIGKGIYDIEAFERALGGCFPENRILSHDLLEGCYARAGLLSDVQLYEDCPASYRADVIRRHRWLRGDWQLAGWLFRRVPGEGMCRHRNPLSRLSQWKLIDNLRRSLVPAALSVLLVLGWTVLAPVAWWTLSILGILIVPPIFVALLDACRKPDEILFRQHLAAVAGSAWRHFRQLGFEVACLPYEAWFSLDAIARTSWRLLVSHRRLLEWNPSSEVERQLAGRRRSELVACLRSMWIGPLLAIVLGSWLVFAGPVEMFIAAPVLLLWLSSPFIAWWLSRPLAAHKAHLTEEQGFFLRRIARRTWAFFEHFAGPDDHWLAPDNYQEYRVAAIAHRTSPTNMGMALLANLSAWDFGYIPTGKLLERTANTLRTMAGLERYRGHFYNWYDTQTLQPLPLLYISTVDSGNLAGHLLTLRGGLLGLADVTILQPCLLAGLNDTLGLLAESADEAVAGTLAAFRKALNAAMLNPPQTISAMARQLQLLGKCADELATDVAASLSVLDETPIENEAAEWVQALVRQLAESQSELEQLAPWLSLPPAPAGLELFARIANEAALPTLRGLARLSAERCPDIETHLAMDLSPEQRHWLLELSRQITLAGKVATRRIALIDAIAEQSGDLAQMDYSFLFDKARHLLTIGYNVTERRVDTSYYDLLASEARLCNFVAIAQGQLPQESWFSLGRLLTGTGGEPALLSWSGSMFEYLMPMLVMPNYENTLLDQTCKAAVARQIEYGKQRGVPWGVSESGYNTVDLHLNYQYRAFGVPGLGLKRGLAEDLVIAPYASALALMVAPEAACLNLQRMADEGFVGKYGFFEAIDYTPARQRRGQSHVVVRSFMAHHQGMSLLALDYLLLNQPMQKRFVADRLFQAILLLLQERIPKVTTLFSHTAELADARSALSVEETPIRVFNTPDTPVPEVQLLSNGRYHVMVTNAGGGYSRWNDLAVTRWREDGTRDNRGSFCYIRELASGTVWSTAYQPTLKRPDHYEAIFSEGRAEFRRRDSLDGGEGEFETYTDIVVSPEDDIELRRTRITNRTRQRREIEVTSYAEVVIAPAAADELHPAFSNLFVQSEILHGRNAVLCTRRPRSLDEQAPWMLHLMAVHDAVSVAVSAETDRSRFIGRTRSTASPLAMDEAGRLSGSDGSVLDPIVAVRHRIVLEPEQSVTIDLVTGIVETRAMALGLVEKYQDRHLADRVFELTWTHSQVVLRQLNATEADAQLYAHLAGSVIHANPSLRADASVLIRNQRGQSGLWGYAISGDLPIVLLQIGDAANIDLVRQLVQAHAYWRLKGLVVDLVIWNEDHAGYRQRLQDQIMGLIASGIEASVIDRPGGIFVRLAEQISSEDRILLQSVARAVITDCRGSLAEQLDQRAPVESRVPRLVPSRRYRPEAPPAATVSGLDLLFHNGLGGFAADGREYVITLAASHSTPAPWANVLANPHFGTVISESGSAYSWCDNAHEFRLTPWHDDPVSDAAGEAIYLRDEETGHVWSPTPLPVRGAMPYTIRHGFGVSTFETSAGGIHSELKVYVAIDAPVKFSVLKLTNNSGRPRQISATGYVEWVLGDLRAKTAMHVSTEVAAGSGALLARNPYSPEFSARVAFFDVDETSRTLTGDRNEFIGRNGSPDEPAALKRARLSGKVGAGLDPCGAIQLVCDLADGEEREVTFRLGVGHGSDEASQLIQRFRGPLAARMALEAVAAYWTHSLGAVQVETPDPALDLLANGWLVYQTLACRVWARSGYYQSGGAFGFRDQLQDMMALVHTEPALVRAHLLLCASRQFAEGDVQHWWHPPSGRGVRTRCSDDYLWLPLAVSRYVQSTGDTGVLDETVCFLEGRPVNPEDDSYYDLPVRSGEIGSLYEHSIRAIRHGLRFGVHGLPLIGSGDWNDGMSRVGILGRGESVWLGFFLYDVLRQFSAVAENHGDPAFAEFCRGEAARLHQSIDQQGWDGAWYRRAYFDDGTPLGSSTSPECRIDSISQSWSVLSGVADASRGRQAMQAVDEHLVRRQAGLIQLLDPPFDKAKLDPGYIRGYVPGVRENGGQYTHGAIWAAMAFAALGDRERAWELTTMINPISHTSSVAAVATYKAEPYVMAADVYALAPHTGRAGWSWYSGSAGWMYRLMLESLLGLRLAGDKLYLSPCLPAGWPGFKIRYRYRATVYHIAVTLGTNTRCSVMVDGMEQADCVIQLVNDLVAHQVVIVASSVPAS